MTDQYDLSGYLSRKINSKLSSSPDKNLKFLWIDDFEPGSVDLRLDESVVQATAFVTEDSGKQFIRYTVMLCLNEVLVDAAKTGDLVRFLTLDRVDDWLTVDRVKKSITIVCS